MKNCPLLLVVILMLLALNPSHAEDAKNETNGETKKETDEESEEESDEESDDKPGEEIYMEVDPETNPSLWDMLKEVNEGVDFAYINGKRVFKITNALRKRLKFKNKFKNFKGFKGLKGLKSLKSLKSVFKKKLNFKKAFKTKFGKVKTKFKKLFKMHDPETVEDDQPGLQ